MLETMLVPMPKSAILAALAMLSAFQPTQQTPSSGTASTPIGNSWQSVRFQSSNDSTLTPEDKTAPLEGTEWRLARLGDTPVISANQQREAYLTFAADTHRVAGSGGCNRLMGSYQLDGDSLTFGLIATTMMACLDSMDTERAFVNALKTVKKWKIIGQQLDLLDSDGKAVAHFDARSQK